MVIFDILSSAGDDLLDWCFQIYKDFRDEHQEEIREETLAGRRKSQVQPIHWKFPPPDDGVLEARRGSEVPRFEKVGGFHEL